ncbi:MAG TPA: hypothetical protein VJG85_02735 [Patescibacteria group bacterium]|nr:hypothetical protein [Patescibacteria group bacterium]
MNTELTTELDGVKARRKAARMGGVSAGLLVFLGTLWYQILLAIQNKISFDYPAVFLALLVGWVWGLAGYVAAGYIFDKSRRRMLLFWPFLTGFLGLASLTMFLIYWAITSATVFIVAKALDLFKFLGQKA